MAMRESPVRPHRRTRPAWLVPLLIGVGVLVVVGLGYGLLTLLKGDDSGQASAGASPSPSACATVLAPTGDSLPKPAKVTVNVYNATSTSGLASKTASELEGRGFTVGKVANDPVGQPITGVAQVRFGPKGAEEARLLLIYVPGAESVPLQRKGAKVDLAVGDAFVGLATEQQVNAALASPAPVPSGLGCATSQPSAPAS